MEIATVQAHNERLCFGPWCFNLTEGLLENANSSTRLQPRIEKLLSIFVSRPNEILSRDSLIDSIWGDKIVNEDALSRCIAELRATLNDSSSAPTFIETIPKKGYRFICPVQYVTLDTEEKLKNSGNFETEAIQTASANTALTSQAGSQFEAAFKSKWALYFLSLSVVLILALAIYWMFSTSALALTGEKMKNALLNAKRLTVDTKVKLQPELSHKGDKVAYVTSRSEDLSIVIVDTQGRELETIKDSEAHLMSPRFSPSDRELLVARFKENDCKLYRYDLASKQRKFLTKCAANAATGVADWSPDGRYIVYTDWVQLSEPSAQPEILKTSIWLMDLETGASTQLTTPNNAQWFDSNPTISPDGRQLAFLRGTSSIRNLYTLQLDDESLIAHSRQNLNLEQLTGDSAFVHNLSWLHESDGLVFDSNKNGERNLWLFDLKSQTQELIGARDSQSPSLDAGGQGLVFKEVKYNANIWRLDMTKDDDFKLLIESIKYNNFPSFSPTGEQVAFVSNRKGQPSIWLYDVQTREQSEVMRLPSADLVNPVWSQDGRSLLISGRGAGGYACYRLNIASQTFETLDGISQQHFGCVDGSDDVWYGISREPNEVNYLFKFDASKRITPITDISVNHVVALPNGRLIYSSPEEQGIFQFQEEDGSMVNLVPDYNNSWSVHWAVAGKSLYFARFKSIELEDGKVLKPGLYRKDLETLEEVYLSSELPSAIGNTLSVDPNQSSLLIAKTDRAIMNLYYAAIE